MNIEIDPLCEIFIKKMAEQDRIQCVEYIEAIGRKSAWILPKVERIECESIPTFKVNIPSGRLTKKWPHGLRILFRIIKYEVKIVKIVNIGSHDTSALYDGKSVYRDEWKR